MGPAGASAPSPELGEQNLRQALGSAPPTGTAKCKVPGCRRSAVSAFGMHHEWPRAFFSCRCQLLPCTCMLYTFTMEVPRCRRSFSLYEASVLLCTSVHVLQKGIQICYYTVLPSNNRETVRNYFVGPFFGLFGVVFRPSAGQSLYSCWSLSVLFFSFSCGCLSAFAAPTTGIMSARELGGLDRSAVLPAGPGETSGDPAQAEGSAHC